jgi:hypothetical protein
MMRVLLLSPVIALLAGHTLAAEAPPAAPAPPEDARTCGASEGIAAGPRQRRLIEKRQAKCRSPRPYQPTVLEQQVLNFEKAERPSIFQLNFHGLYPRVQTIDHRSQWAGGVRFWRPDLKGSRFDLNGSAFWSVQGFRFFEAQAGVVPHRGKAFPRFAHKGDDVFELASVRQDDDTPYMLYATLSHRFAPKFDFFGTGPDSRREDRADFRQRDTLVEGVAGYRVRPYLTVSGRLGFNRTSIGPGEDEELPQIEDVFAPSELPGLARQPDYWRYGLAAVLDRRDVALNPHRGGVVAAQWLRYSPKGDGEPAFHRLALDARGYLSLGHRQRVLALRGYLSRDAPASGGRVPFYLLSFLGNSHTLRAYASQRFRGEKLALLQAEYRVEAAPAIEVAFFLDTGAVAGRREDDLGGFRTEAGLGLRFKTHQALALRLDCAWGGEGFRAAFRFSPSF